MDGRAFVDIIKVVVRDAAISSTLSVLEHPPRRNPGDALREKSGWYKTLSDDDRRVLSAIVADAANAAVFGFLCVLDGVRAIEDGPQKGTLQLHYLKGGTTILNPPVGPVLHEMF